MQLHALKLLILTRRHAVGEHIPSCKLAAWPAHAHPPAAPALPCNCPRLTYPAAPAVPVLQESSEEEESSDEEMEEGEPSAPACCVLRAVACEAGLIPRTAPRQWLVSALAAAGFGVPFSAAV